MALRLHARQFKPSLAVLSRLETGVARWLRMHCTSQRVCVCETASININVFVNRTTASFPSFYVGISESVHGSAESHTLEIDVLLVDVKKLRGRSDDVLVDAHNIV